jgi:hypothetical protein
MLKKRLLTDKSGELQERILAEKAKELANDIDAQILRDMLTELGWYEVLLTPMSWEQGYEVDSWVETNIKGRMWCQGLVWMFENEKDASWFKLRWLS